MKNSQFTALLATALTFAIIVGAAARSGVPASGLGGIGAVYMPSTPIAPSVDDKCKGGALACWDREDHAYTCRTTCDEYGFTRR